MEDRGFDLRIEMIGENNVVLRVWSNEKVNLSIRDVKFYYAEGKYDEDELLNFNFLLNDCAKRHEFSLKKQSSAYRSMNFIVKNSSTHKEYRVRISIPEKVVEYKEL